MNCLMGLMRIGISLFSVINFVLINALILVWLERKISARIQLRYGPLYVGWHGLLQTFADAIKLLGKELIMPQNCDKVLYFIAPIIVFAPIFGTFLVIPFSQNLQIADLNVGVLLIFAFSGLSFIGIFMAGWASNNKYSLLGGMRSVAQNISYEIPLLLSTLGVIMVAKSFKLSDIVTAQNHIPFVFLQPLGFMIYFIASLAESNRTPFDIPEAESELVAGFHTEYSGLKFGIFFISEYTYVFINSCVATALFLGGWHGPFFAGWIWFLIKVYFLVFVIMWVRWTFPRLRSDQLINFGWKVLIPLALFNIISTAIALNFFR
ncbi:MAG: NADH-quinone oxidoreductase subunit NuoH [Chlamydiae bacterium]|nr:NADH-quinone oxidoreductase subunit NuoH [Chlamydiota bacterium]MBI3277821.1 NADH-quinone oxidoreductase subunit NuoH [Chlamydiota bacterium]